MKELLVLGMSLLIISGCNFPKSSTVVETINKPNTGTTINNGTDSPDYTPEVIPPKTTNYSVQYHNSTYNFNLGLPTGFTQANPNFGDLDEKIAQWNIDSDIYTGTNLNEASFTISTAKANSVVECLVMNLPEGAIDFKNAVEINGQKFYQTDGNGAGAGNFYETKTYRVFKNMNCLEFAETIHTSNIGNYDPGTISEIDKASVWKKLESVMNSVKFN